MLANRGEFHCAVIDASSIGLALLGSEPGKVGEHVIIYVEQIGRVEGTIVRHFANGFAVKFDGPSRAATMFGGLAERQRGGP